MKRLTNGVFAALVAAAWGQTATLRAVDVRQMFRPERFQRGDTNVSRVQ